MADFEPRYVRNVPIGSDHEEALFRSVQESIYVPLVRWTTAFKTDDDLLAFARFWVNARFCAGRRSKNLASLVCESDVVITPIGEGVLDRLVTLVLEDLVDQRHCLRIIAGTIGEDEEAEDFWT